MDEKYGLKKWTFRLILWTIFLGIIVPYFAEVICTLKFPDAAAGLNIWNQFVSIVLGIVATVLSIVSLIMSFKNYDDTLAIQEKYTETLKQSEFSMEKITSIAIELSRLRNDINRYGVPKSAVETTSNATQANVKWDADNNKNAI